ncbi:hypothetical protein ACF09Y_26105 [Streptomyces massasporeus]|uniref:hypothetical protein n=1 Tax=Streptomyces massasporeus TaxID=67324 RepID=UPI0036FCF4AA
MPDTLPGTPRPLPYPGLSPSPARRPVPGLPERVRVREMLTYLGTALPRFTSPAARLLALQCALRADARGLVRIPAGLLRGMRLRQSGELWLELAHAGWLELPDLRALPLQLRLLDAAVLDQAPGHRARCRAAHWALRPAPLALPAAAPALRLAALVLASHSPTKAEHSSDMDVLARLCGHSPQQTGELLDRLVTTGTLGAWQHNRVTDEVSWQLPQPQAPTRACQQHRWDRMPQP